MAGAVWPAVEKVGFNKILKAESLSANQAGRLFLLL
jgi:hypothetical protein